MAASAIAELRTDCVVCVVFTSVPLQEVFADLCSKRRCYRQEGLTESKKDEGNLIDLCSSLAGHSNKHQVVLG